MRIPLYLSGTAISEIFSRVWEAGELTPYDRYNLRSALLGMRLTEDDRAAIDRMLHAVRRGWLDMSD
jgi:hypothetical protein